MPLLPFVIFIVALIVALIVYNKRKKKDPEPPVNNGSANANQQRSSKGTPYTNQNYSGKTTGSWSREPADNSVNARTGGGQIRIVSLKCPDCGAALSLEEGRSQAFCTYCGAKIMLSNENEYVHRTIDEAEIKKSRSSPRHLYKQN